MCLGITNEAKHSAVIARLDRAIQYAAASPVELKRLWLLDARLRAHDEERRPDV
jgi:hypothetical protein